MFRRAALSALLIVAFEACAQKLPAEGQSEEALAGALGKQIVDACPLADPSDAAARDRCADALTRLELLKSVMSDPFFWGAQAAGAGYDFAKSNKTDFNPLVWRRMYLSTLMFSGEVRVERAGTRVVIHLPNRFRNALDAGAYPYPFWHSKDKWDSYQRSTELLVFLEGGKLIGALRSAEKASDRALVDHQWDGRWRWTDDKGDEPYVSLYSYLFSKDNPHTAKVEAAYRALESEMRGESCTACHSPDNTMKMNPLELFAFPNQALSGRHRIVAQLEANQMPPVEGVPDQEERATLLRLARAFAAAGDEALAFEGEDPTTGPR
jgi:hypothetical protein